MRINKDNCEAFFLDYYEGNLNLQQVAELMIFLEQNPGLKKGFEEFENIMLEAEGQTFTGKVLLKKAVPNENIQDRLIALLEDTLNPEEKKGLEAQIKKDPALQLQLKQFRQTVLVPEADLIYPDKASLKKKERKPVVISLYHYLAVAASLAIVAGLYLFFNIDPPATLKYSLIEKRHLPLGSVYKSSLPSPNENKNSFSTSLSAKSKQVVKRDPPDKQENAAPAENQIAMSVDTVSKSPVNEVLVASAAATDPSPASFKTISASDFLEKKIESPKKTGFWDLAVLCSKGLNKLTGKKVELKKESTPDNSRVEYVVSAGRYGFSRSISK